jgi:hypothetical protein
MAVAPSLMFTKVRGHLRRRTAHATRFVHDNESSMIDKPSVIADTAMAALGPFPSGMARSAKPASWVRIPEGAAISITKDGT